MRLIVWLVLRCRSTRKVPERRPVVEMLNQPNRSLEDIARHAVKELLPGDHPVDGDRVHALALRLGVLGAPPRTLEEAGKLVGITREAVRQIQSKAEKRLPLSDPPAELLDAIESVRAMLPKAAPTVGARLQEEGRSEGEFSVESLTRLAALWELALPYKLIADTRMTTLVVGQGSAIAGGVERVLAAAETLDGRLHLVSASAIAEDLNRGVGGETTVDDVALVLSSSERWMALAGGWFYRVGAPKCSLFGQSRMLLSLGTALTVPQLREGLRRRQAGRSWQPPPSSTVLTSFYELDPQFDLLDGRVRLAAGIEPVVFDGANAKIIEIFRHSDTPALTRNQFMDAAHRAGIPRASAQHYVTYHPLIERVGHNVWTLIGTSVPPGVAESLREHARATSRPTESASGVDSQGRPWFAVRLRPTEINSGVISLDKMTMSLVGGLKFALSTTMEGKDHPWNISTSEGFLYGLAGLMGRFDPDPGDVVRIVFNIHSQQACATLGGEELLT
jgi:hypothetical protein